MQNSPVFTDNIMCLYAATEILPNEKSPSVTDVACYTFATCGYKTKAGYYWD